MCTAPTTANETISFYLNAVFLTETGSLALQSRWDIENSHIKEKGQ